MTIPSIFFNYSSDPNLKEINLTKSLLNVFGSSKTNLFFHFLNDIIDFGNDRNIKINFPNDILNCQAEVHLEEHGRIDAIIKYDTGLFYIECKHGTNKFTESQLSKYIKKLGKGETDDLKILILIANYHPSDKFLDGLYETKSVLLLPLTWDDVYERFDVIKKELSKDYLDFFLLEQFQKYLIEMNIVTSRFSSEEAKLLSNPNCDWSSIPKPFKKKLKIYFDNLKNELVNLGFDEKGFSRIDYSKSRFENPTLRYKDPKIDKNRNIILRFELSDKGKPSFIFEFIENEKNSKLYKNILNNKEFEKKIRKVTYPRFISTNISQEKDKYIFGNNKELSSFNITTDLSKFNGKVGFILFDELEPSKYESSDLFNIVVEAFKQNKFIIDEYL